LAVVKKDGSLNETVKQIAMADRIILNKIDLVTKQELSQLENTIRSINGVAKMVHSVQSKVDLSFVLDIAAFDADRIKNTLDFEQQQQQQQKMTQNNKIDSDLQNHVHDENCKHDHSHEEENDDNLSSGISHHLEQVSGNLL
jgi:G3E family GTPase